MIKTIIRENISAEVKLPNEFKIRLLESTSENSIVNFIGVYNGVKICSGSFYTVGVYNGVELREEPVIKYEFINYTSSASKTFESICKILDVKLEWTPPHYPQVPKVFDGNSIKEYFNDLFGAIIKVPVKSRLLMIDQNFRFQPDDNSAKITAPRYRVEISFLGDVFFAIDLARGPKNTFIQNQMNTDSNFVPVDARVLVQFKKLVTKSDGGSTSKSVGKFVPKTKLNSNDFFHYVEKARELFR